MSLFFNWTYVVRKSMHMDLSAKSYLPSLWLGSMLQTLRKVIWLLYYLLCLPPQSSQLLFQTWSNIFPPCRKTFVTLQVSLTLNIRTPAFQKQKKWDSYLCTFFEFCHLCSAAALKSYVFTIVVFLFTICTMLLLIL